MQAGSGNEGTKMKSRKTNKIHHAINQVPQNKNKTPDTFFFRFHKFRKKMSSFLKHLSKQYFSKYFIHSKWKLIFESK